MARRVDEPKDRPGIWLEYCGVVPFTESNLTLVKRGMSEDYQAMHSDQSHPLPQ
jgi:hypothetical protein